MRDDFLGEFVIVGICVAPLRVGSRMNIVVMLLVSYCCFVFPEVSRGKVEIVETG